MLRAWVIERACVLFHVAYITQSGPRCGPRCVCTSSSRVWMTTASAALVTRKVYAAAAEEGRARFLIVPPDAFVAVSLRCVGLVLRLLPNQPIDGIPSGAVAAKQNSRYFYGQRRGLPPRRGLPVRPEHDRAQSCAIALRSPASERPSDITDIHQIFTPVFSVGFCPSFEKLP